MTGTITKLLKNSLLAGCLSATFLASACQNNSQVPPETSIENQAVDKKEVIIINYLTFPILDESIEGIIKQIGQTYDDTQVDIKVLNANADSTILAGMVNEVISQKPDLIIPVSTPVTFDVLSNVPRSQQVVFSTVTTPKDTGYHEELPNVTGVTDLVDYSANFDLMLDLFPDTKTIGMIYSSSEAAAQFGLKKSKELAEIHGIALIDVAVSNSSEVISAARNLEPKIDLLYIGSDIGVSTTMPGLANSEFNKPVFSSDNLSVKDGALAAVSVDYVNLGETAGKMAVEVLKGKPAGDIDNVIYIGDELAINTTAAKKLNFVFPDEIIEKADKTYGE